MSELGLTMFKRCNARDGRSADRGSLLLLWSVTVLSVGAAFASRRLAPRWDVGAGAFATYAGVTTYVCGLALRWYSIVYLGRFFTVNVAIASDHRLIESGPYRLIRHPSYTGALMALLGTALCLDNYASIGAMVTAPFLVFSWRMRIEEQTLGRAFGDAYLNYSRRTKRLVPMVY